MKNNTPTNTRVLIIEDHKDIAEMLYDYFERRDYEWIMPVTA